MDLILLIILARTFYNGFARGAIAELVNLLGVITITALACNFYSTVGMWLTPWWAWDPAMLPFIVFLLLLLGGMLLFHLAIRKLMALVKWERVHWALQTLGLILGGLRGAWWAGLLLMIMLSMGIPYLKQSVEERSLLAPRALPVLQTSMETVVDVFPGHAGRSHLVPSVTMPLPKLPSELRR